jgi:hypothetical protein
MEEHFALDLHGCFYELRVDPYVEILWKMSSLGFLHLIGALERSARVCGGQHVAVGEYLPRLGQRSGWQPYSDQMNEWKTRERE